MYSGIPTYKETCLEVARSLSRSEPPPPRPLKHVPDGRRNNSNITRQQNDGQRVVQWNSNYASSYHQAVVARNNNWTDLYHTFLSPVTRCCNFSPASPGLLKRAHYLGVKNRVTYLISSLCTFVFIVTSTLGGL